jgi:hypothetical protein
MEKEFVPYKQALALKELLGFDEECLKIWEKTMLFTTLVNPEEFKRVVSERYTKAPTFSQAFRWFREEYDLRIWIESNHGVSKFEYVIATTNHNFIDKQFNDFSSYKTYEEAELACLEKLIEIVEQKEK